MLQVLGEPRAREILPPQMTPEYVRKLLDVFRVSLSLPALHAMCLFYGYAVMPTGSRLKGRSSYMNLRDTNTMWAELGQPLPSNPAL